MYVGCTFVCMGSRFDVKSVFKLLKSTVFVDTLNNLMDLEGSQRIEGMPFVLFYLLI